MSNLLNKASIVLTPTASNNGETLCVKPSDGSGDFDFSRNSAATRVNAQGLVENVQILSSNLVQNGDFSEEGAEEVSNGSFSQEGSELIVNGNFATDSDWNKDDSWSISNGTANYNYISGRNMNTSTAPLVVGKTYKLVYTLLDYVSGSVENSSAETQIQRNSNGTYIEYFVARFTFLRFRGSLGGEFSIDNVSVKEVAQDWDLDTSWSIGVNSAIYDGLNSSNDLQQTNVLNGVIGTSYAISFEVTSGTLRLLFGEGAIGLVSYANYGVGVHTVYGKTTTSATGFRIYATNTDGGTSGSVTNISVKEVGQNWALDTGWSIGDSEAIHTGAGSYIQQGSLTAGSNYKVVIDVTQASGSGFPQIYMGGLTTAMTSIDTYTFYITAQAGDTIKLRGLNDCKIGSISVIEITDDTNLPRINYEGFSYQDALGSEEVVNGDFEDGGSNWSVIGVSPTFTNSTAVFENNARIYQTNAAVAGKKNKVVINFNEISGNGIRIYYGGGLQIVYSVQDIIDNGYKIEETIEFVGGETLYIYSLNLDTYAIIDNVSVKEYLGQEVVPDSGCGHWLWEPQSTNVLPYSLDFSNWLLGSGASVNTNQILSPDGTQNAYTLNSSQISSRVQFNVFGLTGVYAQSIYLKYAGDDVTVRIRRNQSDDYFELIVNSNGISANIIGSGVIDYSIEDVGNDWYRVWNTQNNISYYQIYVDVTGNQGSVYAWGAQLEAQDFATSLIPTDGTSVTRNQDVCNNGGSLASINSTEGVLYFEGSALVDGGSNRIISLSDETNDNLVQFRYDTTAGRITSFIRGNGGSYAIKTINGFPQANNNKVALVWNATNLRVWINGTESGSVSTNDLPIAMNTLSFTQPTGSANFFGKTKCLAVWKEALSDTELTSLTTI